MWCRRSLWFYTCRYEFGQSAPMQLLFFSSELYKCVPGYLQWLRLQQALLHLRGLHHSARQRRGQPPPVVPAVFPDQLGDGQTVRERWLQRPGEPHGEGGEGVRVHVKVVRVPLKDISPSLTRRMGRWCWSRGRCSPETGTRTGVSRSVTGYCEVRSG